MQEPVLVTHDYPKGWNENSVRFLMQDLMNNLDPAAGVLHRDTRTFIYASNGLSLIGKEYVKRIAETSRLTLDGRGIDMAPESVEVVESWVRSLRLADDATGGTHINRLIAHNYLCLLTDCLLKGSFPTEKSKREYYRVAAQLSQICGWLSYDARAHGAAQRYLIFGLQLAHVGTDPAIGAHLLRTLSEQALFQGSLNQGFHFAHLAREVAERTSKAVQSVVVSGVAMAEGAQGNEKGLRRATEEAEQLFQESLKERRESWLYWLNQDLLDSRCGFGLLFLAKSAIGNRRRLLSEAAKKLPPQMKEDASKWPRDVFYHVTWQARAQLLMNNLEEAVQTGKSMLNMPMNALSPRVVKLLRRFDGELGGKRYGSHPEVHDLRLEFRRMFTEFEANHTA